MGTAKASARASRSDRKIVFDLQRHWMFRREDSGQWMRLDELEQRARLEPGIHGHAVLGDSSRTPRVRVLVAISADGLSLWDVRTRISHRFAHRALRTDYSELAALLKALP